MKNKRDKIIKWIIIILFVVAVLTATILSCVLNSKNKELDKLKDENYHIEEQLDNLE